MPDKVPWYVMALPSGLQISVWSFALWIKNADISTFAPAPASPPCIERDLLYLLLTLLTLYINWAIWQRYKKK